MFGRYGCAIALATIACDPPVVGTDAGARTSAPLASASAASTATGGFTAKPMPPRPVPIGESGPIQPNDPPEKQMMTITYTVAMVAPQPGDPPIIDDAYVERMVKELSRVAPTVAGRVTGSKEPEPARGAKGNRKLEVDVDTCTDATPLQLIKAAGSSFEEARNAGVLVIACRGSKWECHQSTRDPKDVLCHAAPR